MTLPVTVIIPTFNRADFISACLESILGQTCPPQQIIVVDDGSTDKTGEVISHFSKVEYIRKSNGGKSSAINAALPLLKGEYVWIMDDDDIALPDALNQLLKPHLNNPQLGYSFGYQIAAKIVGETITPITPERRMPSYFDPLLHRYRLTEYNYFSLNSCLIRYRTFIETGKFDERLVRSQDYDFLLRLSIKAKVAYIDKHIYWLREHSGMRGSEMNPIQFQDRNQAWIKYDRIVGKKVLDTYSDDAFIHPNLESYSSAERFRSCKLRRAYIAASKGLVEEAENYLHAVHSFDDPAKLPNLNEIDRVTLMQIFGEIDFLKAVREDPAFREKIFTSIASIPGANPKKMLLKRLYWNARLAFSKGRIMDGVDYVRDFSKALT